jgi:hypothetical protein
MDGSLFGKEFCPTYQPEVTSCSNEPSNLEARLALTPETMTDAFKLRHASYLSYGYIEPRNNSQFYDEYDLRESCKTVVVYKGGVPAASVRICLLDPDQDAREANSIPATEIFHDEIHALLDGIRPGTRPPRAVEVTRLARHPDHGEDKSLVYALFRLAGYLILHYEADVVLTAVRAHHMAFYRRLGFHKLEDPRAYPNLKFSTGLMACFRSKFADVREQVAFLRNISRQDRFYRSFIAGEMVPVLSSPQNARPLRALERSNYHARGMAMTA